MGFDDCVADSDIIAIIERKIKYFVNYNEPDIITEENLNEWEKEICYNEIYNTKNL